MPKSSWRGTCYIYNYLTREFLRHITTFGKNRRGKQGSTCCRWTPGTIKAYAYRDPDAARRTAARINREIYRYDGSKYPCAPVDVVSGEAARCLDLINRRGN